MAPRRLGLFEKMVLLILVLLRLEMHSIPSSSMYPTLRVGDQIIVEKASYYFKSPAVHDIVTFRAPSQALHPGLVGEEDVLIKRIVAKSGDLVQVHNGLLYVNGTAQYEDFIAEQPRYTTDLTFVPKGHVYVLGDNRNNSYDSHFWGTLPIENILGRYLMTCYTDHETTDVRKIKEC